MHALCRADGAGLADSGLGLGTSSRPAEHPGICKRPEAPGRTGVLDSRYSRFSVPGVSSLPHLALASVESWKCLGARRREREGERASWARRPRVGGGGLAQLGTQLLHSSQAHCISKGYRSPEWIRWGMSSQCSLARLASWDLTWSWLGRCARVCQLCQVHCSGLLRLPKGDARGAHRLNSKQPLARSGRAVT